jgi:hypothetical protein
MLLPHREESWIYRVDPSRENKIKTYKVQAGRGEEERRFTEFIIKYNDYREHLWLSCEGWTVFLTYETLPYYFRYFFLDIYDLVLAMRCNHSFISLEDNMLMTLTFEWKTDDDLRLFEQIKEEHPDIRMRRIDYKRHV